MKKERFIISKCKVDLTQGINHARCYKIKMGLDVDYYMEMYLPPDET
jgi:hypothetical protein